MSSIPRNPFISILCIHAKGEIVILHISHFLHYMVQADIGGTLDTDNFFTIVSQI